MNYVNLHSDKRDKQIFLEYKGEHFTHIHVGKSRGAKILLSSSSRYDWQYPSYLQIMLHAQCNSKMCALGQYELTLCLLFCHPFHSTLREGWLYQNGWIFGKVPKKGGRGAFSIQNFWQKILLRISGTFCLPCTISQMTNLGNFPHFRIFQAKFMECT